MYQFICVFWGLLISEIYGFNKYIGKCENMYKIGIIGWNFCGYFNVDICIYCYLSVWQENKFNNIVGESS